MGLPQDISSEPLVIQKLRQVALSFDPMLSAFIKNEIDDVLVQEQAQYAVSLIGERERPFLVRIATDLIQRNPDETLPLALSAELFISSALTGDDLIDGATTRWGRESVWCKYGRPAGLLIPELLHALAQTVLDRLAEINPGNKARGSRRVAEDYRRAYRDFFVWQHLESSLAGVSTVTEQQCIDLAYWRTGRLLQLCFSSPATLYECDPTTVATLDDAGRFLGTAFQLRDDLIDFIGEPEMTGKPAFGDLKNGQPNIVLAHFFSHATDQQRIKMLEWWNVPDREPDGEMALTLGLESGSISHVYGVVSTLCGNARSRLLSLQPSESRDLLVAFVDIVSQLPLVE